MYDIVSQDDGNGGSAECNNREYGGYIDEYGFVLEVEQGDVKSPCINESVNITLPKGYSTFQSHPSGNCESYITNDELRTPYYIQSPSDEDYRIAGSHTCYVFGRRDGYVYVYNREGTQAKIQTSVFISHTKFVKP